MPTANPTCLTPRSDRAAGSRMRSDRVAYHAAEKEICREGPWHTCARTFELWIWASLFPLLVCELWILIALIALILIAIVDSYRGSRFPPGPVRDGALARRFPDLLAHAPRRQAPHRAEGSHVPEQGGVRRFLCATNCRFAWVLSLWELCILLFIRPLPILMSICVYVYV